VRPAVKGSNPFSLRRERPVRGLRE